MEGLTNDAIRLDSSCRHEALITGALKLVRVDGVFIDHRVELGAHVLDHPRHHLPRGAELSSPPPLLLPLVLSPSLLLLLLLWRWYLEVVDVRVASRERWEGEALEQVRRGRRELLLIRGRQSRHLEVGERLAEPELVDDVARIDRVVRVVVLG